VTADHRRLRQVLINLLSNAIKYNCIGGSVWLSLSHEPAPDGSAAGWICMTVSDTGPGLTQGQIDAMYQPFNRLGAELSEVEGTGLGLSVARDLAEAMGGSLQVQSETGKGSVFTLRLVAADLPWLVLGGGADLDAAGITGVASDVNPADAFQVELSRGPPRPFVVLYVEDNRLNVMVMRHAIKRLPGVHLEVAIDGGTGLALAQRLRPDLLLLDMNMPVLSGTEVMLRVRADPALATLTCVAVSANSLPEDIERAMSAGFDDYITKPFAVARVLDLVDRLRRGAGPNPEHERGIGVA
jgi:CheY-like chemotaxis protein/anti-sigma regulatory factor (Ser/Thr protein kinase)